MATYYHRHPRNFGNECTFVRCENASDTEEAEAEGYERLTRAELASHVRWINGENDAWGSGRAFGRISLAAITNPRHPQYHEYAWSAGW